MMITNNGISAAHSVYTIGHSNWSAVDFLALLKAHGIQLLVDVRRFASSKKWPQFEKSQLSILLAEQDIQYIHLDALGGRSAPSKDSKNTVWRHPSFRGYADYMETQEFLSGVARLTTLAMQQTTVIMCAEILWWRCHRALIADFLKVNGWQVIHIMGAAKTVPHPYSAAAKVNNGILSYTP